MSRDPGARGGIGRRGRGARGATSSRDTLLAAVALQDHIARTMRMPGGPKTLPSTQPGAEMTLAQHLGLIPRPPPLLTETEWNDVHLKARLRQHSTEECPICQVLLSCSHVFHKSCLSSFERYARQRCCPLCRAVQYQKKVIQDGAEAFKEKCAIRIQAAARGWLARRRFKQLRRHHAPKDARLKRNWAAERLEESATKMVADMDAERGDIDALFAELDASLALSRAVCDELEGPAAKRLQERLQATSLPVPSSSGPDPQMDPEEEDELITALRQRAQRTSATSQQPGHNQGITGSHIAIGTGSSHAEEQQLQGGPAAVDWDGVVALAKARGASECPICIGKLGRRGNAGIAWLSCTHCFHLECITAFEAYELSAGGSPTCPVCRAAYQRRCFQ